MIDSKNNKQNAARGGAPSPGNARDRFYDYQLFEYEPVSSPVGKHPSSALLARTFEAENCDPVALSLVESLKKNVGKNRTVWGVKNVDKRVSWELYFYNYRRHPLIPDIPNMLASDVLPHVKPHIRCPNPPDENIPYSMFSFDLDTSRFEKKTLTGYHVYVINQSSILSYDIGEDGCEKENFYHCVFDPSTQKKELIETMLDSPFLDSRVDLEEVLPPPLFPCKHVAVAKKRLADGVYFSGLTVNQLTFFLERFQFPDYVRAFVSSQITKLDHLLYDVGFDYRKRQGKLDILKSSFFRLVLKTQKTIHYNSGHALAFVGGVSTVSPSSIITTSIDDPARSSRTVSASRTLPTIAP